MMDLKNKRKIGTHGEELAEAWLTQRGYEIVEKNHYTPRGEIDIVAYLDGIYYFVEVKYRRSLKYGSPKEALTASKLKAMRYSAMSYVAEKQAYIQYKISFLGITSAVQDDINYEWLENVFE